MTKPNDIDNAIRFIGKAQKGVQDLDAILTEAQERATRQSYISLALALGLAIVIVAWMIVS